MFVMLKKKKKKENAVDNPSATCFALALTQAVDF